VGPLLLASLLGLLLAWLPALDARAQLWQGTLLEGAGPGAHNGEALAGWLGENRAQRCGRFWCSPVMFPYLLRQRDPLTVAHAPTPEQGPEAAAQAVRERAETVQQSVKGVISQLRRQMRSEEAAVNGGRFWSVRTAKPLHPLTPTVAVGFRNNVPVVFVPADSERSLGPVTLLSVTEPDAVVSGTSTMDLAEHWRVLLQRVFSEALWGLEFNRQLPLGRPLLALLCGATLLMALRALASLRKLLHGVLQRLRRSDQALRESATRDLMAAYSGQLPSSRDSEPDAQAAQGPESWGGAVEGAVPPPPSEPLPASGLRERGLRNQASNLLELGLLSTSLVELSLVIASAGVIGAIFPASRVMALLLMRQALMIPLLWLGLLVVRWLLLLAIDHSINTWSIEATLRNPSSRRYAMQAVTSAKLLKNLASIACGGLGVIATLLLLGVDGSLLTGAGVVAVGLGLLLRNLVDDLIQGLLVITTDRFAVGDVVTIPPHSGLVENMSLFHTQLRGFDGQVSSLPNGQIRVVENLTKDWSRVNFVIEVAASENLREVLQLIRHVAEEMSEDPDWASYVIGTPEVLGVDEVRQSGCLIRVWIQTQPLRQWLVGREFRLRVKEAFDRAGIRLGLPRQELLVEHAPRDASQLP
jgi:small conductance mechanosensitive channel